MHDGEWELCRFALGDQELGVTRGEPAASTRIPMTCLHEVRVHHDADGAIDMVELVGRNGRTMAARPRPALVDGLLARVWEAHATIRTTTVDA